MITNNQLLISNAKGENLVSMCRTEEDGEKMLYGNYLVTFNDCWINNEVCISFVGKYSTDPLYNEFHGKFFIKSSTIG